MGSITNSLKKLAAVLKNNSDSSSIPGDNISDVIDEITKVAKTGSMGSGGYLTVHIIEENVEVDDPDPNASPKGGSSTKASSDPEAIHIWRFDKTAAELEAAINADIPIQVVASAVIDEETVEGEVHSVSVATSSLRTSSVIYLNNELYGYEYTISIESNIPEIFHAKELSEYPCVDENGHYPYENGSDSGNDGQTVV